MQSKMELKKWHSEKWRLPKIIYISMPNSFKACCLTLFHVKTGQCCPPPSLEECSSLELDDLIFFFFTYFSPFGLRWPCITFAHIEKFPIITLVLSAPDLSGRDAFDYFLCDEVDGRLIWGNSYLTQGVTVSCRWYLVFGKTYSWGLLCLPG